MYVPVLFRDVIQRVEQRWVARIITVLNLIGFLWGIVFWYGGHFLHGKDGLGPPPLWHWPFIPDCPLFAGLFVVSFVSILRGRRWHLWNTIVAMGLIKYGVWTDMFWTNFWLRGGPVELLGVTMALSHLGMILQGLYLLAYLPLRQRDVLVSFIWFLLSDYVDYGLGEYPDFPGNLVPLALMQWHTIAMTFVLSGIFWALGKRRSRILAKVAAPSVSQRTVSW
ncbi:MAG TPA: DUF1405 domain-containing protein [Anaerolineae bacterium]|nr:DUF1405 domain-containing protein [Anaerolineae bacterium]HIQ04754.1 DUF1405 domain-containing protein [Anaerolineae bacterium]